MERGSFSTHTGLTLIFRVLDFCNFPNGWVPQQTHIKMSYEGNWLGRVFIWWECALFIGVCLCKCHMLSMMMMMTATATATTLRYWTKGVVYDDVLYTFARWCSFCGALMMVIWILYEYFVNIKFLLIIDNVNVICYYVISIL